jgi:hypothetical protein
MDNPRIDKEYLELGAKIVAAAASSGTCGQMMLNSPDSAAELLRAVTLELYALRSGQYELPQKK